MPEPDRSHVIAKRIAANMRRLRTTRGLTQEQLAELCDLHLRSVQKIEGAEINVLAATLIQIRSALKCSWEELLGR